MRHIHVEIAHPCTEPRPELSAREEDLPLTPEGPRVGVVSGAGPGVGPGPLRPFGEEEIKLQKVYQLSIFSQRGFIDPPDGQRALRPGGKRGPEEPLPTHKRPHLAISSHAGASVIEHRDPAPSHSPNGQAVRTPLPARRPALHNHHRPLPDAQAPLSPKYQLLADPQAPLSPRTGALSAGGAQGSTPGQHGSEDRCSRSTLGLEAFSTEPTVWAPCQPTGSLPAEPLGPLEAREWVERLESSPPERQAASANGLPANGLPSSEKTPSGPLTPAPSCAVKKRLLSSSDTGDSCSEDEGPSTSKRSRLALLAPGLGLGACRSTDAKGAPFWNHLLPAARERPKGATDGARVGRRLSCGIRLKSRQLRSGRRSEPYPSGRSSWPSISHSLLGNFEESILKGRFSPSGRIEGFTAEIGASGSYCPQHATLPVQVTYYDISEHSAPSPFLGVIYLEPLGKKGYSVPKAGTIQVTLFNPNKTVVKMFLVTYNFGDMPVNHLTFLRHRIFLVPVEEGEGPEGGATDRKKILCYLIHLRFQSSKSGKLYLHDDIRLLFSRKSIEVDTGIPYEQKSYTEVPRNPKYSPRV
ncbi:hypothetical protein AAFF_G00023830 [Aldrovandia affinis]|uniref:Atos homolog protein B n=1 Tax=Aldrovandia affinis TaxID=143900 RepID=A0AAD7T5S9_9TELE|nr:hypothetical protein AAFF_G00023830 [Aldrovandia affinis]